MGKRVGARFFYACRETAQNQWSGAWVLSVFFGTSGHKQVTATGQSSHNINVQKESHMNLAVAKMTAPTLTLSNGQKIPCIGLGTYAAEDNRRSISDAVKGAIDIGYRLFDTAAIYKSEGLVGDGVRAKIREGVIKREDVFIVTKLWNNAHDPKRVLPACKESLANLGLNYIDLYLMHWPIAYPEHAEGIWPVDEKNVPLVSDVDYVETWKAMEECVKLGLVKSIGVSNFNSEQIDRLLGTAKIKPVLNQIECHVKLNQKKLRAFCTKRGIQTMAYSPLGAPGFNWRADSHDNKHIGENPIIQKIADKREKSTAQIALRYLVDIGTIPIPKSVTADRIKENFDIFDFKLSPAEIASISTLDSGYRMCAVEHLKSHQYYPFHLDF